MVIICSLISKDNLKKAEYAPTGTSNINLTLITKVVPKLHTLGSHKRTLTQGKLEINYEYDATLKVGYFCVCKEGTPKRFY
jgi:hypothetical protein